MHTPLPSSDMVPALPASANTGHGLARSLHHFRCMAMAILMALAAHAERAEAATTVIGFDTGTTEVTASNLGPNDFLFDAPVGTVGIGLDNNNNTSFTLGITRTIGAGEIGVNQSGTLSFSFGADLYTATGPANGTITFTLVPSLRRNTDIVWTGTPQQITETYDTDGLPTTGSHFTTWTGGTADTAFTDGDDLTVEFFLGNPGDPNATFIGGSGQGGPQSPQAINMTFTTWAIPEPTKAALVL
jgi:hypothetical protein